MRIFLSYASEDRDLADEINLALLGKGYRVFFDKTSLPEGREYHSRIESEVQGSDVFVFLITPNSVAKGSYARTEMEFARKKWPHPASKVLPVLLRPTPEIPAYLKSVTLLEPQGNAAAEILAAIALYVTKVGPPGPLTRLSRIRHTSRTPADKNKDEQTGLDKLPHLWIRTNHSNPQITWRHVDKGESSKIVRIIRDHYGNSSGSPIDIERPAHVESSDVYRIADRNPDNRPIMLKVFRRRRPDSELRTLCAIHKEIADADIFCEYSDCLRPVVTTSGREWTLPSDSTDEAQAIAFSFLREARTGEATHFKGESENEIEAVAEKLGRVNAVLVQKTLAMPPVKFRFEPEEWKRVAIEVKVDHVMPSRIKYIGWAERDFIERIQGQLTSLNPGVYPPTLNDFHPHNVFVAQGNCLVIVDYENVRDDWPEVATCTLALHRLCREYVRKCFRESRQVIKDPATIVQSAAAAFLSGYGKARPDVIPAVRDTGFRWARAINFAKLTGIIAYDRKWWPDPTNRPERSQFAELVKFVSYLKELDVFEAALSK